MPQCFCFFCFFFDSFSSFRFFSPPAPSTLGTDTDLGTSSCFCMPLSSAEERAACCASTMVCCVGGIVDSGYI